MKLVDLLICLVLVVALGPALLAAAVGVLVAVAPVALPGFFVAVVLWWFFSPNTPKEE